MKHVIRLAYAIALAMVVGACGGASDAPARNQERASRAHAAPSFGGPHRSASAGTGFRSRAAMDRHFAKHGAEFGGVTEAEYLREAQALRDAPVGGTVEESTRPDGTLSRYDRASGAFIEFDPDGTILTFFKPNTGESYFRRQATHTHTH